MFARFRSSLIVTAAVFLLQVYSSCIPACGQMSSPRPPAQGSQNQEQLESPSPSKLTTEERKAELLASIYFQEIRAIRWDDIRAQQAIERGKKPHPETRYRGILSPEEQRIACDVLLDASHQIDEIDRQFVILNDEVHEHYSAELADKRAALSARRGQILDQAVANLKSSLGEDAFDRLTKFLCPAADESAPQKDPNN